MAASIICSHADILVQVLCAHVFGVALLHEAETLYGLAGSAAIAAGVITVNGAKMGNVLPQRLSDDDRGGDLPQYCPVPTGSGPPQVRACL